jgi:5-methylcytosine-specific restriction endonuclease McrA
MRKLTKPLDDPGSVFLTCISRVRNIGLKSRLTSVEATIVAAANEFEAAASTTTLHTLLPQNDVNGIVTKQEMLEVYTNRMAKKDAPGRSIYDKLLAAPVHGRCPLCGQRVVSTLDHYLPKTEYPALAVVPINLVPACADCNKTKIAAIPKTADQETIHPYFDDVETDLWLYAKVIETSPAVLQFFVKPHVDWDIVKAKRIEHHFKVFKLSYLYTSHAATELLNIRDRLAQLFSKTGYKGVNAHLSEEAATRESAYLNSWQTAMYKALAANFWYCSGGFNA